MRSIPCDNFFVYASVREAQAAVLAVPGRHMRRPGPGKRVLNINNIRKCNSDIIENEEDSG